MKRQMRRDSWETPIFGMRERRGVRLLRGGERFVFHGQKLQYLQIDASQAALVHLDERGRLADCPSCFAVYSGPIQLRRNGPDSAYGFTLDAGRDYFLMHSDCGRPLLQLTSVDT